MAGWPLNKPVQVKKLRRVMCTCGHNLTWHQFTLDKWVGKCTRKKTWRDPRIPDQACSCTDFVLLI